ncbi:MAG: ComEA family DNA-binding protein [Alloprevotella sp.]
MRKRWSTEDQKTLALAALLVGVAVAVVWSWHHFAQSEHTPPLTERERAALSSLGEQLRARSVPASTAKDPKPAARLFAFDPNRADSLSLLELGLKPWQVGNLMKYRRKGGRWRSPEHFSRLYGLTREEFERLRPYVRIADADGARRPAERRSGGRDGAEEPPRYQPAEKYAEGTVIALNAADTAELKHIPGIGSWRARRIVDYRSRLGGFVSVAQIEELDDMPPGLSRWFTLGDVSLRTIRINRASFRELVRHPYLSYEQTKVIVNHIRKYGPLTSWRDLQLYEEFAPADFERLAPYFRFD